MRRNIFGLSGGEQAMDAALSGKKPSKKALKWMKEHDATTKKLKKRARREMQFSGRINPNDEPDFSPGTTITVLAAPAGTFDLGELSKAVRDGVIEALKETVEQTEQETILDRIDDAAAAVADENPDEALDILNGLLDDYAD